jgi:ribosomal protein S18 acetylase RimI-like enzyme
MKTNNFTYRKATLCDDLAKIARYIHMTDPYIYPSVCKDPCDKDFKRIISQCASDKTNLFYRENICLALADEKIIGILVAAPCGRRLTFLENIEISESERKMFSTSDEGYFKPLIEETEALSGFNITNVCIDPDYRSLGVGEALLRYFLSLCGGAEVHLDVIADNSAAIRLYEKCGFRTEKEYLGFSGNDTPLPCYHMIRRS